MSREEPQDEADEAAGEARSRRIMALNVAWGVATLLLLWWFARSFAP